MKRIILLFAAIFTALLLITPEKAEATHASAGYITYQYVSPNTYLLTLRFYRDCVGVGAPASAGVSYSSSCGGGGTVTLTQVPGTGQPVEQSPCVPPVNTTCTGGLAYGVQEWVYTGTVTLPVSCADWTFSYSLCCRNNAIGTLINPGSHSLYIETTLNSLIAPTNSSPVFSSIAITQFCINSPVIWNQFAVDPDNDSLVYSIVCPWQGAGTSVNFAGGYSCAQPIQAAPPVAINSATGQITFTPTLSQVAVIAVKVDEYRGGTLIGSIRRDMQLNVVANCSTVPFDNAWLGFNNNWDDPINWCQGIPTLLTNAVVRSLRPTAYFSPIIKDGIVAQAKSLKVSNGDSVSIDSPTSGSFTMADSMRTTTGGALINRGSFNGDQKFGPGTSALAQFTPFADPRTDARMQIIYTAAELSGNRMLAGDQIEQLCFHIASRRSISPYLNFTINYYTTNQNGYVVNQNAVTTGGPYLVYSSAAESLLGIPPFQPGDHNVVLDAPIVWNGGNLLIEICFDEFTLDGSYTQDIMFQTRTVGRNSVILQEQTGVVLTAVGCNLVTGMPGVLSTISEYRPNITFKYFRSYDEYPITVGGTWDNNGTFRAGDSEVLFNGLGIQAITGTTPTTFDDVRLNKGGGQVIQLTPATIDSTLTLTNGVFSLNSNTLTMNYSSPTAISSTNGYMLSENTPPAPYGIVKWNLGSTPGSYEVPFANILGRRLPLTLTASSGNFGQVEFSTYPSGINNWPRPNGVTNTPYVFTDMVDRYWMIVRSTGGGITADLTVSYDEANEETSLNPNTSPKHLTRWNGATWDFTAPSPGAPYVSILGRREMTLTGLSVIEPVWSVGNDPITLPVELLTFDGEARNSYNHLWWVTATEINSDRFEIEKSLDLVNFEKIGTVKAKGFSITESYYAMRDINPVNGIQYYRLKTIDLDGSYEYSKTIAIYYGPETNFEVVSIVPNSTKDLISIDFVYNSSKDLNIIVTDLVGKTIHQEVYSKKVGDNHHIDLNVNLSSAFYFITFFNDDIRVTKKFAF